MPTETELELMECVISRARAWTLRPTSIELRQKVEWAIRALDSFQHKTDDLPSGATFNQEEPNELQQCAGSKGNSNTLHQ